MNAEQIRRSRDCHVDSVGEEEAIDTLTSNSYTTKGTVRGDVVDYSTGQPNSLLCASHETTRPLQSQPFASAGEPPRFFQPRPCKRV